MNYSISLVLFDFVPVFAFLVGAFYLVKISLSHRGKPCGRMMMAGTALVFAGGFFKATWKLFYTLDIGDYKLLSELQFILSAFGFFAMLVSVILLARSFRDKSAGGVVMAIAAWKIPFLAIMTLTSLGAQGILVYISFQKKARQAAGFFIIAVICMLGMAGLASSVEQTVTMQWIEETINSIGQISFALGSFLLHRKCETLTESI